jgi:hypothetical protein
MASQTKVLTKKERREQIKAELDAAKKAAAGKDLWLKIFIGLVVIAAIGGFVWLFLNAKEQEKASVSELGQVTCTGDQCVRAHIAAGTAHEAYNSNPPSNGPHYDTPAQCKIYENEVVDESAVHSLEHGAVWVTYKDKTNTSLRDQLTALIKEEGSGKILLSPRAKNESAIGLASWGRVLNLDSFDKQKIADYIRLYRNGKATPEPLAPC